MTSIQMLTYASPAILIIGSGIGYIKYKSLDKIHKCIVWYLFMMLIVDVAHRILGGTGNNLMLLSAYSLLEAVAFLFFYYRYMFLSKHRVSFAISCICIAYILWEMLTFKKVEAKSFQSYAKVADNFIVISLVLAYFYESINRFKDSKWNHFTLNVIILIFFSLTLIFFLPYNFIISGSSGLQFYFWMSILIATVLFYIYLSICIWKNAHTNKKVTVKTKL